jgi:hypothetical protein
VFYSKFAKLGTDSNREMLGDGKVLTWNHFYYKLPSELVHKSSDSVESAQSKMRSTKQVIERSLKELNLSAIDTTLDLINDNILYRGEEFQKVITEFRDAKLAYDMLTSKEFKNNLCWEYTVNDGRRLAIRNTAIGTLLINLSEGMDVEKAVKIYEGVMAPQNYKRPKAIFTERMKEDAKKTLVELGLGESLGRRYAKLEDISIQNVLWASGESKTVMKGGIDDVFDSIKPTGVKPKFKGIKDTSIDVFVKEILPSAETIELMLENSHKNNLVSLVAPKNQDAPSLFKWGNGFSWSYNGDFTDSIKEAVKTRGGKVDGVLRCSLSWAEGDTNDNSDLDIHCKFPGGHIYYSSKSHRSSGGELDVDIINPSGYGHSNIVENITWPSKSKMPKGEYRFYVNNYSLRGSQKGFTVEIEFDGEVHTFEYNVPLRNDENVDVAVVNFDGEKFTIKEILPSSQGRKEMWGITSQDFIPVKTFMYSPNHWDGEGVGNRHHFFMLENCTNDGNARGFFNEFLRSDLEKHRKVFEALGGKMKVEHSDNQLSGVGFSSTKDNIVTLRVDGKVMNINFNTKNDGKSISKSSEKQISL